MPPVQIALWIVLGVALVISVVTDVSSARILDVVTWPTIGVALAIRLIGWGVGDLETGLVSGVVAAAGLMGLFALWAWRGKMGWGDVKLMGAVGAALGYPGAMAALIFTALVGALQAIVTLLWKGQLWDTFGGWLRRWAMKVRLLPKDAQQAPQRHIPYGVAIAVGSAWAMWWERSNG